MTDSGQSGIDKARVVADCIERLDGLDNMSSPLTIHSEAIDKLSELLALYDQEAGIEAREAEQ